MSTAIRLYLGWRLLRMLRPLLCATMIIAVVFASHLNNETPNRSAAGRSRAGPRLPGSTCRARSSARPTDRRRAA